MRTVFGIALLVAGAASVAQAQTLPGGVQLGMTPDQLQQAVPGLRAERSARAPRGFAAAWSASGLDVAGVPVSASFAMADGQLQRIEYLASPQAYDALLQWGRTTFGPEMASSGPEGQYASWSNDAMDAYLQRAAGTPVRLVVKRRVVKDASEL